MDDLTASLTHRPPGHRRHCYEIPVGPLRASAIAVMRFRLETLTYRWWMEPLCWLHGGHRWTAWCCARCGSQRPPNEEFSRMAGAYSAR